eukprot:CAMPEP_0170198558 /NCGR_PEP_ID=MMETSP0040_2-20121228/68843_1 /TAXON_ID=641309 /ORGANISM="Lotharella oceanica, Strain CCMP622" /LENGTH=90 /DNA_ID=CAMNT_0010448565 /DNA_START=793 /DNA_END=1065 /DNA_ORIENTATION=+
MMKWTFHAGNASSSLVNVNAIFKRMQDFRFMCDSLNDAAKGERLRSDLDICVPNMWTHGEVMRAREQHGDWKGTLSLYRKVLMLTAAQQE